MHLYISYQIQIPWYYLATITTRKIYLDYWMMSAVMELKFHSLTVPLDEWECITALLVKLLVLHATMVSSLLILCVWEAINPSLV